MITNNKSNVRWNNNWRLLWVAYKQEWSKNWPGYYIFAVFPSMILYALDKTKTIDSETFLGQLVSLAFLLFILAMPIFVGFIKAWWRYWR